MRDSAECFANADTVSVSHNPFVSVFIVSAIQLLSIILLIVCREYFAQQQQHWAMVCFDTLSMVKILRTIHTSMDNQSVSTHGHSRLF